jgi:hypothetical protein
MFKDSRERGGIGEVQDNDPWVDFALFDETVSFAF